MDLLRKFDCLLFCFGHFKAIAFTLVAPEATQTVSELPLAKLPPPIALSQPRPGKVQPNKDAWEPQHQKVRQTVGKLGQASVLEEHQVKMVASDG